MNGEGYNASKILTWVLGIVGGVISIGVVAAVSMLVGMGDRLTRIEATIDENKLERTRQVNDLERRVSRLEERDDRRGPIE